MSVKLLLGVKTPTFLRKIFQFARVFQEKNAKTPLNFPVHTKKIKTPPSKIFWIRPWSDTKKLQESSWHKLLKLKIYSAATLSMININSKQSYPSPQHKKNPLNISRNFPLSLNNLFSEFHK